MEYVLMYLPQGQHCYVILCIKLRYLNLEGKKKSRRQKKKSYTQFTYRKKTNHYYTIGVLWITWMLAVVNNFEKES